MWFFLVLYASVECFIARDRPNDGGGSIYLSWKSIEDTLIDGYVIFRRVISDTVFTRIGFAGRYATNFEDNSVQDSLKYIYQIAVQKKDSLYYHTTSNIAQSSAQFFHKGRLNILFAIIIFAVFLIYFVSRAKKGAKLFIRKIAGLDAVEEAVGRATEMGKPILYVPGLGDIDFPSVIASMNILGEIAKKSAIYENPIIVANCYPVVYTVAREVVKQAYMSEGKIDKFKDDYIRYLTESQFGYAAAINGIILRERPATNFFIGPFFAESLLLAETGNQTGAVQIAGTDQVLQLPFFVVACDYTLLGEEVYAASAYLTREPVLVASLKAQDMGKLLSLFILILLTVLAFFKINLISLLKVQ
ncbi:MAG: hypothetical protein N3A65_05265 [candidate division WOR-3 bacterium]|nr:hypothetical protein [candidate division WOR-3 bacterium]